MKRDGWTFLTNHGHVLVCLAGDPEVLLRDIASSIGVTERCVQQIVGDLERAGMIVRRRVGRRNRYIVRRDEEFRHPVEAGVTIGEFLDLVEDSRGSLRQLPPARLRLSSVPGTRRPHPTPWADGTSAMRGPR